MSLLEIKNLTISFGDKKVFENLSFELKEGELLGVYGKNGSGKTSLCYAIGRVLSEGEISGEIIVNGKNIMDLSIAQKCQIIGMVFQQPDTQLFSPIVEDELSFAPENLCIEREQIKERINTAVEICNIKHLLCRKTNTLSGGEKQLVAIASTLTMSPKILLADEITSRVDKNNKKVIKDILRKFVTDGGGVIFVSHNKEDLEICTRTIEL